MDILGIGTIFTRGRGVACLEQALEQGWVAPEGAPDRSALAYRVKQELIKNSEITRKMRRADLFSMMAVLAADDAVTDSGIPIEHVCSSLGIIVATGFGPHVTTFRFLDDIIDYDEKSVSPTTFSHSIHNAAASYIASILSSNGPTLTVTQFPLSFHHALIIAQAWLKEKRCKKVLVGSIDECGSVMEYIAHKRLRVDKEGKIRPFTFTREPVTIPGEGSVFYLLGADNGQTKYCKIDRIDINNKKNNERKPDLILLDADGMAGDESVYKAQTNDSIPVGGYSPLYGAMMTGSAFHCAVGVIMIKNNIRYACPVQDNPYNINISESTEQCELNRIQCIKYSCSNKFGNIQLIKGGEEDENE